MRTDQSKHRAALRRRKKRPKLIRGLLFSENPAVVEVDRYLCYAGTTPGQSKGAHSALCQLNCKMGEAEEGDRVCVCVCARARVCTPVRAL